ncbi:hypothetical protein V8C86DRAFT_3083545 [Haematococcus lacustris]
MATAWTTERPSFTWLWDDATFADATLHFRLADKAANAARRTTLPVHRAVLASNSKYFRARLLRWAGNEPEDASSIEDSPAASTSSLVVRCMYEGGLAEGMEDPLTLATTLPDSCALLPEHQQWQERVHTSTVKTYGDVHATITSAQLRDQFQQLPFMAVQQWAGSNELTVDSENSVVELISLWMAGPAGQACSQTNKQQLSCLVRVQHLSPGVLNTPPPAWAAPPRKQLGAAEVLQRTTIRWDVPQQQLAALLAREYLTVEVASQPVYHAGCGWRLHLNQCKEDAEEEGEPSFTLGCWGELCTYANCEGHPLGARLLHGAPIKFAINKDADSGVKLAASPHSMSGAWVTHSYGYKSFLEKSINKTVDLVPFLINGCLQITATFQVLHRPGQP